jgi:hypothetical protein
MAAASSPAPTRGALADGTAAALDGHDAHATSDAAMPRFDFEVLQHASAVAVRRVRGETLPALTELLQEAIAVERTGRGHRWPAARKLVLVTRLSALSGCIEQLAMLERLLVSQHGTGLHERGATRVATQLREAQEECRDVEERGVTLLVQIQ